VTWALLAFAATAQAPVDIRIALVIGNGAYPGTAALANPANDAQAMSAALRGLGFNVVELRDASQQQMLAGIELVRASLTGKQGVGMLYYAGHGLQLDWHNFMVPVDARLSTSADVAAKTVDVNAVIDAFKVAGNRMNIVVLDACRDNPFRDKASAKGLAPIDAPSGTFLAYATAPGNVADDGDTTGGNGLYTQFLLEELKKPSAKIEDVFKRVRFQVRQKSQGRQIPWESTSLEDDFFFHSQNKTVPFALDAKGKEDAFNLEKAAWDKIKLSTDADDFYAFLQAYPTGAISEAAQARLQTLAKAQVAAAPVQVLQDKPVVLPHQRFQLGDKYHVVERDGLTNAETRRLTLTVTGIKDDVAEVNNGAQLFTLSGGTSRISFGRFAINFDPPLMNFPAGELQVGKKWQTRTTMALPWPLSKGWIDLSLKTVGRETIQTEAGSFDTFKTEVTGSTFEGAQLDVTYWSDPAYGHPVRLRWFERKSSRVTKAFVQDWAKTPERTVVAGK
jgi:hypothetical protein